LATFRASSTNWVNNTPSNTVNAPSGVAQGDYLIAYVQSGDNDGTFGAPSGWKSLENGPDAGNKDPLPSQIFYKIATASEPGSYKFTFTSNNGGWAVTLVDYYNTTGTDTINNAFSSGLASSLAAPSVTTSQASETVVVFWAAVNGSTITPPGGVTSRVAWTDGGGDGFLVGDYAGPGTPGSTSPGTATDGSADWGAVTLCLLSTVPGAPTLTAPANSSYSDLASTGGPFSWQYNGGLTETGYHFRLKISGGSYTYWNAGSNAFQGTDVANTSSSLSVTFPGSAIADGHTYNWSVASVDANGTGSYANDWTVTAQVSPTVTVSAPTGTIVTTQQPAVTWSTSLAPGAAQGTYRVVTYNATQYSAVGFTPGSGPSTDDSGVVTSGGVTYTPGLLPNGTSYESYVQITQTPGGLASAWAFTSFSIALDSPAQPTITAVAGNDSAGVSDIAGSAGTPRIALTVQCQDNFLTANQAALINGNTTGWTAGAGDTITAVTSPTPPTAEGAYSMQVAGSGTNSANTPTGTSGIAVLGSTSYTALASFRSASTARSCNVAIGWYTSAGSLISTSTSSNVTDSSSAWTQALITATSPSNAAFASITVTILSTASENHYVAEIGLMPGTVSAWTRGGLVGSTTVAILRSDGLYVRHASSANPTSVPASSQQITVYDYEPTPVTSYTYSAIVSAVLAGNQVVSSTPGTSASVSVPSAQGFWFINPINYAQAVDPMVTAWNPSQTEQSSSNQVLNQTTQVVVAGAMGAMDLTASVSCFSAASYQAMNGLATSQQTIFVSDPFGLSYYFRLGPQPGGMSSGTGNKVHDTQLNMSVASAPYRTIAITGIGQARPAV
jgi:hypothetical protein